MADFSQAQQIAQSLLQQLESQRSAYLNEACGDDADLRQHVEAICAAHARTAVDLRETKANTATSATSDFVPSAGDTDAQSAYPTHTEPTASVGSGTIIAGKYVLASVIGEGGMGEVWLANQTDPVKREVAVKLIKAGVDSRQVVARFEAERQALAVMDHPNIAKILDGGSVGGIGIPFFVMELVRGVPITRFCDQQRLSPLERLHLFIPVCEAIQHAHQKGIIHRDIKPSNILVAMSDGRPVPKVIDFGVAKATGQSLTDKTLNTVVGAVVGTPQ